MIAFSVGLSDSALDTASSTSSTDVTSPTLTSADCAIPSNHPTSTTLIAQSYALQQPPRTDIDAPFGADRAGTHPCPICVHGMGAPDRGTLRAVRNVPGLHPHTAQVSGRAVARRCACDSERRVFALLGRRLSGGGVAGGTCGHSEAWRSVLGGRQWWLEKLERDPSWSRLR